MSKVEVDQVTQQSGTTLTVGGGACKTAVVDATTVTLGRCGGTVSLASGATQSGFGRTGTVDWITTPKVTGDSPVTGVTGKGYFLNTTAGTITINLPAGAAGSIVSVADYAGTWQTNAVTVAANGTEKIGGVDANVTLNTEGQSVTLVYVDAVQGWINTMDSTSNVRGNAFIVATGGTPSQDGDYEIRTFTGPGTFCVSATGTTAPVNAVDYLIVGGAGGADGGAGHSASGGGAGGYRESPGAATSYTASPLGASPAAAVTVTVQGYAVVVGAGGTGLLTSGGTPSNQAGGNVSSVFSLTGAAGGSGNPGGAPTAGNPGGSGGGGSGNNTPATAGLGNQPPVSPSQGSNGGDAVPSLGPGIRAGGGGGGAGGVGGQGQSSNVAGAGGVGTPSQITGSAVSYAGGGGGSNQIGPLGTGGGASPCGTGGAGALGPSNPGPGGAGSVNKGGGGGAGYGAAGGNGGSGVVIIRYKFQ